MCLCLCKKEKQNPVTPTFRRAVLGHAAGMLLHGRGRGHAVEQLDSLPVGPRHHVAAALVVAGEHAARHHEVCARAERLRHVAGARAAAVLERGYILVRHT